jgi:hypothetical protein
VFGTVRRVGEIEDMAVAGHLHAAENIARARNGDLTLTEALEVTIGAIRGPERNPELWGRMASRWLERWIAEQRRRPGIYETLRVATALAALDGHQHTQAAAILHAVATEARSPGRSSFGF